VNALLVPVDGSECSLKALDAAVTLAQPLGAEIVLCHVVDLGKASGMSGGEPLLLDGCYEALRTEGEYILEKAVSRAGPAVKVSTRMVDGAPIEEIQKAAQEIRPRIVVIGSHGRSGFNRMLMGSVAEGVARGCCVPVMIVPVEHAVAKTA
jgi:nucleotide-binding universal stress UspA family protein